VNSFAIWRFFKKYPKCLVVEDSEDLAEADGRDLILRDYSEFGARMKRERGYKCDRCRIELAVSGLHKFLHVAYDEAARKKPNPKNVKVLCLKCHADEPKHAHLKSTLEYREFARRFGQVRVEPIQRNESAEPVPAAPIRLFAPPR
jgi:hypothetical protein